MNWKTVFKISNLKLAVPKLWAIPKYFKIAILILIIGLIGFGIFKSVENAKADTYRNFLIQENQVDLTHLRVKIGLVRSEYREFYKDCDEIEEYNKLVEKDTRNMTIKELERAIELNKKCGFTFYDQKSSALEDFDSEVSKLFGSVFRVKDSRYKSLAEQIANDWREIVSLEREKLLVLSQHLNRRVSYWNTELEYSRGKMTITKRNQEFDKLNNAIERENEEYQKLDNKIETILSRKNDMLNRFKTETGVNFVRFNFGL